MDLEFYYIKILGICSQLYKQASKNPSSLTSKNIIYQKHHWKKNGSIPFLLSQIHKEG